jgi:hypothetical protein
LGIKFRLLLSVEVWPVEGGAESHRPGFGGGFGEGSDGFDDCGGEGACYHLAFHLSGGFDSLNSLSP